jgi:type I restriction enzyme M protein
MDQATHSKIVSFLWGIADDVLRDLFKRGKYPDVILPMCVLRHEPDSELRDTEQVPLLEPRGIEAFFRREVLPHVPDAWIDPDGIKIGYEISFTRYFCQPKPLRTLDEIRADILAVQNEAEGLLDELVQGAAK